MDTYPNFTLLRQGAEARVFTGQFLGQKALIKDRFSKKYRHPQLDEKLNQERLKGEVRSLLRCKSIGVRTPTVYLADVDSNMLVMEYFEDSVTARDKIRALMAKKTSGESELRSISSAIGKVLGRLHKNNIIHGDLTTSNILITEALGSDYVDRLVVIDFGLGYAEGVAEDKGVDLYVLERAFLSTHPNTEHLFRLILEAYKVEMGGDESAQEIVKKFEEIRMRGRKRTMVG